MASNLKDNERQLIRLITFFKKRAEKLMEAGELDKEHTTLLDACNRLTGILEVHAANRAEVTAQREMLKGLVKDNAVCPKCDKSTHLKARGVDVHEKGWKNNRYVCKRCNIEFVWNRPNNPWDMIPFIEQSIIEMQDKLKDESLQEIKDQSMEMIAQMQGNLEKLRPVIEASDTAYEDLQSREQEMAKMIHDFKNLLLIEKIKMDTWKG